ncbi:MAG: HIT domain-containing protein [Candidatus Wallbacteria bacterium]|nr:HIT domain-containing protein [Candidatus Wallbacteria bacterium]
MKSNLFIPEKFDYVRRNKRPAVRCILCAYENKDSIVELLDVHEGKSLQVACNLYPYNPGHIMIFPKRHLTDVRELSASEWDELIMLQKKSMDILDRIYSPKGFNLGFNVGEASGASIEHLHLHIVPRYKNELGFIDILAGAKIYVEGPQVTRDRLREEFRKLKL